MLRNDINTEFIAGSRGAVAGPSRACWLVDPGSSNTIPFDIRHNVVIFYDTSPTGRDVLRQRIEDAVRAVLEDDVTDLAAVRQIIMPSSIVGDLTDSSPAFVVASSPLSFREAYRRAGGWRRRAETISDYVGIRGLMWAFGVTLNMQALPELVNPDDFDESALDQPIHLYLIGSPKANRWTRIVMEKFFRNRFPKWEFRPDPESDSIRNPNVIITVDGDKFKPRGFKETERIRNDFGIVLRGPSPSGTKLMVTVLAGRSSLGTEAASLAVTNPACIRKLIRKIKEQDINPEEHEEGFVAVVSVRCKDGESVKYETDVDSFTVLSVDKCPEGTGANAHR